MSSRKNKKQHRSANHKAKQDTQPSPRLNTEPYTEPKDKNSSTATNKTDNEVQSVVRFKAFVARSGPSDWLLTMFTGALVAVAIYQFIIMSGQLKVMTADERAWLTVAPAPIPTRNLVVDQPLSTSVIITNTGKTPAKNIIGHFFIEIVGNGEIPSFDVHHPQNLYTAGTMAPNSPMTMPVIRQRLKAGGSGEAEDSPLTTDEKTSLDKGDSWIAVHAVIGYDDIFGTRHWLTFCVWRGTHSGDYKAQSCADYNSTDNN